MEGWFDRFYDGITCSDDMRESIVRRIEETDQLYNGKWQDQWI